MFATSYYSVLWPGDTMRGLEFDAGATVASFA